MGLGHALRDRVDTSHRDVSCDCVPFSRSRRPARPCPDGRRRRRRARSPRRRRGPGSGKATRSTSKRRALYICGTRQMSASVTSSPNRKRPARGAASASSASKPSRIQWRYQSSRASWSMPSRGEMLQHAQIVERVDVGGDGQRQREHMGAIVRIGGRAAAPGKRASSQAMMARLWVSRSPSASSIGTKPCGLRAR